MGNNLNNKNNKYELITINNFCYNNFIKFYSFDDIQLNIQEFIDYCDNNEEKSINNLFITYNKEPYILSFIKKESNFLVFSNPYNIISLSIKNNKINYIYFSCQENNHDYIRLENSITVRIEEKNSIKKYRICYKDKEKQELVYFNFLKHTHHLNQKSQLSFYFKKNVFHFSLIKDEIKVKYFIENYSIDNIWFNKNNNDIVDIFILSRIYNFQNLFQFFINDFIIVYKALKESNKLLFERNTFKNIISFL
jgi:hypothetical protein